MSLEEYRLWLDRNVPKATTTPTSWGEDAMPFLPYLIALIFLLGCSGSITACIIFGGDTWKIFMKALFGKERFLALYKMDVVHKFSPAEFEREWDDLPPRPDLSDIARRKADAAAGKALEDACRAAFAQGRASLVSVHWATGFGPRKEAAAVRHAVMVVRARGLEEEEENARLIEEGENWCDNLEREINLIEAMEMAFPSLTVDFRNLTKPPLPGAPWAGTTVGHTIDCDKRREVWGQIEELNQAIKIATDGGVSDGMLGQGRQLLHELVARTPELPADRCVLDPGGKGVKVLPKGTQRALWYHTGDSYLYEPETERKDGNELNNFELTPNDNLVDTSVDPCRPVCATFAKTKNCKLGKRCPWRHSQPVEGDIIREPIGFR